MEHDDPSRPLPRAQAASIANARSTIAAGRLPLSQALRFAAAAAVESDELVPETMTRSMIEARLG